MKPEITVILIANHAKKYYDPRAYIEPLIEQGLSHDLYEIIYVDTFKENRGRSLDSIIKSNKSFNLKTESLPLSSRAKALNLALSITAGELIIFLADDCIASSKCIKTHWDFHQKNKDINKIGVSSILIPDDKKSTFSTWLEESGELFGVPFTVNMNEIFTDFFYIANSSIKRTFLETAGFYFEEIFPYHGWDDFELSLRLKEQGMKAFFLPDASSIHDHRITVRERCNTMIESGVSAGIYEKKGGRELGWKGRIYHSMLRYALSVLKQLSYYSFNRNKKHLYTAYTSLLNFHFKFGYLKFKFCNRKYLKEND